MIGKLFSALFLLVLGGGLTYYGLGHHIVRTEQRTVVVPKDQLELADTYADIRGWSARDFSRHPKLTEALMARGYGELMAEGRLESLGNVIEDTIDKITGGGDAE